MRIAMHATFAASKKEPLAEMIGRVRQAFLDAGLGEPTIRFTLTDTPGAKSISAIDRVLKHHPEMERFVTNRKLPGGLTGARMISNAATGEVAEYSLLHAIALGIPRSYPFHSVGLHFYAPEFGERLIGLPAMGHSLPGVVITDNWWVSGRQRALSVYTVFDANETDQKLPPNPETVDAVIKAFGKARRAVQVPILAPGGRLATSIPRENEEAVKAIVADYRARIREVVASAGMPHNLPPAAEIRQQDLGVLAGPRKPALETAFKPMGYSCRGGTGEFHLTRRTSGNLTAELYLDVGTWSHEVSADFLVHGAGFRASLEIPVPPTPSGNTRSATLPSGKGLLRTLPLWFANSIELLFPRSSKRPGLRLPGINPTPGRPARAKGGVESASPSREVPSRPACLQQLCDEWGISTP